MEKKQFFAPASYGKMPISDVIVLCIMASYMTISCIDYFLGKDIILDILIVVAYIFLAYYGGKKRNEKARKRGFYIDGETLYYKSGKKRSEIDINDIAAIKIVKHYSLANTNYVYRKENGEYVYSAMLLREVERGMTGWNKDILFERKFQKQIICSFIYDEEAINYLIKLKPDIKRITDKIWE